MLIISNKKFILNALVEPLNCDKMEYLAKIIHKTHLSYLPTLYPVQFYGMPNGKVLFTYARDVASKTQQEFIFAEHKEFSYDYSRGKLLLHKNGIMKDAMNNEMIDKPDPAYTIFLVSKTIRSYTEAFNKLNHLANKMMNGNKAGKTIKLNTITETKTQTYTGWVLNYWKHFNDLFQEGQRLLSLIFHRILIVTCFPEFISSNKAFDYKGLYCMAKTLLDFPLNDYLNYIHSIFLMKKLPRTK